MLEELEIIRRKIEELKPKNHLDIILLVDMSLGDRLLRVPHGGRWYGIVNKKYFRAEIEPHLIVKSTQCGRNGPIIPLGIPVIEDEDLANAIFDDFALLKESEEGNEDHFRSIGRGGKGTKGAKEHGTITAAAPIKTGEIIFWENTPIGVAARNIEAGEIIEYSPLKNTKDVIIGRVFLAPPGGNNDAAT